MKSLPRFPRRTLLQQSLPALALTALGGSLLPAGAAVPPARKRSAADRDKAVALLDAKGREYISLAKKDGQFLHLLTRLLRPKHVLEIGSGYGFGSIWMGLALEEYGGQLTGLEILPERVQLSRQHLKEVGLAERSTIVEGDAHQLVTTLDGPFDLVVLNADKIGTLDYFKKLFPKKLSAGAVVVAGGAIRAQEKMQNYLDAISKHAEFDTVVLSATMDDGFAVSCRRASS